MGSIVNSSEKAVAGIFNSYIAACGIAAAWEVGLLDEFRTNKTVNIDSFATVNGLDKRSTRGLISALTTADVLKYNGTHVVPGGLFEEAYRTKSLFHWLTLGSGSVFSRMQYILRNENREGNFFSRDSAAIAYACRDANEQFIDPVFLKAVNSTGLNYTSVVDLGSGSGARLMQILDRFPNSTAIGIDIAGPAIKFAQTDAEKRGYSGRITFLEGDVRKLEYRQEFAQVDMITSFLMGHDFWPRNDCIDSLRMLRKAFPKVRKFFLCDTMRILVDNPETRYAVSEDCVPIFTLGFEFGHALMDVTLPTVEDWEGVFESGGWRCVQQHHMMPPSLTMLFELEPLEGLES
ncbi:Ff.00g117130.m01.CDS01 [Fusarium sp. VM40]|nr:Ff.00g117130.m01.CDS01 [Fusarium sp. VM40]